MLITAPSEKVLTDYELLKLCNSANMFPGLVLRDLSFTAS